MLDYIILLFTIICGDTFYNPRVAPILYCESNAIGNSGIAKREVSFLCVMKFLFFAPSLMQFYLCPPGTVLVQKFFIDGQ